MPILSLYGPVYDLPAIPITKPRVSLLRGTIRTLTISELNTQGPVYSFKDEVKAKYILHHLYALLLLLAQSTEHVCSQTDQRLLTNRRCKRAGEQHCISWRTAVDDVFERQDAAPVNEPQITSQKTESSSSVEQLPETKSNSSEETRLRQTWRNVSKNEVHIFGGKLLKVRILRRQFYRNSSWK